MEDHDHRVMTEANNAHLAASLLRVIARAQERDLQPDDEARDLIKQLRTELVTSWMGAREVAVHALTPEPPAPPEDQPFSWQLDLYGRFREFHRHPDPSDHARWVASMLRSVEVLEASPWSEIDEDDRASILEQLAPFLRWLTSSQSSVAPRFQAPAAA